MGMPNGFSMGMIASPRNILAAAATGMAGLETPPILYRRMYPATSWANAGGDSAQAGRPCLPRRPRQTQPATRRRHQRHHRPGGVEARQTGPLERIDVIVGIDQVERGKPVPDVYIKAARSLNLDPSECTALDDGDLGVRAAPAAGLKTMIQIP